MHLNTYAAVPCTRGTYAGGGACLQPKSAPQALKWPVRFQQPNSIIFKPRIHPASILYIMGSNPRPDKIVASEQHIGDGSEIRFFED